MSFSPETRKAIDEVVLALSVANEGLGQNSFDADLTTADDANAFLYATLAEIPENDVERDVFEHYLGVFRQGGTMPEFIDGDLEYNRTAMMEYLVDMERYFEDLEYVPEGTLGESSVSNKRGRSDDDWDYDGADDAEENTAPPPEQNTRRRVGTGRRRRGGNGDVLVAAAPPPPPPPPEEEKNDIEPEQYSKEQILAALATTNDYLENESAYVVYQDPHLPTKDEAYKYFKGLIDGSYASNYSEGDVTDIKNTLRYITNFLVPIPTFTNNATSNNTKLRRWMTTAQAKIFQADTTLAGSGKPARVAESELAREFRKSEPAAKALMNSAEGTAERAMLIRPPRIERQDPAEARAQRLAEAEAREAERLSRITSAPPPPTVSPHTALETRDAGVDFVRFNLFGSDAMYKARREREEKRKKEAAKELLTNLMAQDITDSTVFPDDVIESEIEILKDNPEMRPFVRKLKAEASQRADRRYRAHIAAVKQGKSVLGTKFVPPKTSDYFSAQGRYRGAARFWERRYFPG
jgi:hypothetical protein